MIKNNYLVYLFKKNLITIAIFSLLACLVFLAMALANINAPSSKLEGIFFISTIGCHFLLLIEGLVLIPINMGHFKNKVAIDTYFALPMNRFSMGNTILLFTILEVLIAGILSNTIGNLIFLTLIKKIHLFGTYFYISMLVIILICLFVIIFSALFIITNHIIDGILTMLGYIVVPFAMCIVITNSIYFFVINTSLGTTIYDCLKYGLNPFYTIYSFSKAFYLFKTNTNSYIPMFCTIAIAIIFYIVYIHKFTTVKAEDTGKITNHILVYPLLISCGVLSVLSMKNLINLNVADNLLIVVIALAICLFGNFIYHRQISFKVRYIISFIVLLGLTMGFQYLTVATKGFGLPYQFKFHNKFTLHANKERKTLIVIDDSQHQSDSVQIEMDDKLKVLLLEFMTTETDRYYESKRYNIINEYRFTAMQNGNVDINFIDDDRDRRNNYYYFYKDFDEKKLKEIVDYIATKYPVNILDYGDGRGEREEIKKPYKGNESSYWGF